MDKALSNYSVSPSSNPEKRLLTATNPLTTSTTTNPFTGAVNSTINSTINSMNPLQQLPHQQHQQQPLMGPVANPTAQQLLGMSPNPMHDQHTQQPLLGAMTNPVAQQLMGMAPNPMHQQQLMAPKTNPILNSVNNLMHRPRQHDMMGPMLNPMMQNRGETNSIFSASDDNVIMKQVLDTHLPDGFDVDVKPLVHIVEEILRHATINSALNTDSTALVARADVDKLETKTHQTYAVQILNVLSHTIDRLACEMSFKCLTGVDGNTIALSLFQDVGHFHWDAKLALILAAFALNYGEFWLLAQIYSTNQLAKSMAILRQVPTIMEHSAPLKSRFDALSRLIQSVLELTRCIMKFKELPSMYVGPEVPALTKALNAVPTAVYWNVRGIIACAAQITSLTSMSHEYGISSSETQSWELSSLVHKIDHLHEFLRKLLEECYRVIDERKESEFINSFNLLFDTLHIDNMKVLKTLLNPRDDPLPLYDGTAKQRVNLEVLRKRNVLLLISGLDMSRDELLILEQIYTDSRVGPRMDAMYDVVWVPIVDPYGQYTDDMHTQFEDMKNTMPWYTVTHPSNVDRAVKRSIGERWHFRNKPILVVLDPQGRELSPNALHMMWIWGGLAFPFTTAKEQALWRDEAWRLELLIGGMDATILDWARENKYIFLYGGDDIEWIRKFANSARAMAKAAGISLELAYVGKSKKKENVRRVMANIRSENLGHSLQDLTTIWFFWTRIESMLFSKIQLKQADDHQDLIMLQIKKLLSYDKDGSWAMLCKGSQLLTNGHGSTMWQTPADYNLWSDHVPTMGFDLAFKEYHDKLHGAANNCCRFEFPVAAGRIPENMRCPECHRAMEKHTAFLCCHDQIGYLDPY